MIPSAKLRRLVITGSAAVVGAAVGWFVFSTEGTAPEAPEAALSIPTEAPVPRVAPADEAPRMAAVQRYLHASEYVMTLRASVRQMIKTLGPQLQASAAAGSDPLATVNVTAVESAIAPLVARHLTLAQAQEIAAFYESEAGHFLVRQMQQGALAPPEPSAASPHEAAIEKFFSSEAGRILIAVNAEPEVTGAVMHAAGMQTPH